MSSDGDVVAELRSVLAHWHNTPYLENHPLTRRIGPKTDGRGSSRAQALRRMLRLAIEMLQPIADLPPNSPEARPYEILCRRYIARQSVPQIALDLGIGERQAYRELRSAVEALARILQDRGDDNQPPGLFDGHGAKVREEVERLATARNREVDMAELLGEVVGSAQQLARDRGINIQVMTEEPGVRVAANRVMLRQAVLNLLSHMVRNHKGDQLVVWLGRAEDSACIRFAYHPPAFTNLSRPDEPYGVSKQLFESLGAQFTRDQLDDGTIDLSVRIPLAREPIVLIVDDNEGMTTLLTRYLQHSAYRAHSANSFDKALEVLNRVQPDVVIIDVMMPEHDGWELMESLRTTVPGSKARVIVCSIINDPELATALGSDAFLHKPVTRQGLLLALGSVLDQAD